MIPRARVPLLCVYALLAVCGLISLVSPLASVSELVGLPVIAKIWGGFFLVGGVVAFASLVARITKGPALGWWYIEISGICLLTTSTFIYASVIIALVVLGGGMHLLALASLVLGLASSLIGRAIDAYRIAKLEQKLLDEMTQRDRRI